MHTKIKTERGIIMIENDTIKLLRECDSGVEMGVSSISDVIDRVHNSKMKSTLSDCKHAHEKLKTEVTSLLDSYHDDGKSPNPMAKGMSWMKTNMEMAVNNSDNTIASLMTDGCNMGVKSLNKYLNQYAAADEKSKDITKKLIKLEQGLIEDMEEYL